MLKSKPRTIIIPRLATSKMAEKIANTFDFLIIGKLASSITRKPLPMLNLFASFLARRQSKIALVTVKEQKREVAIPIIKVRPKPFTEPVPIL